MRFGNLWIRPCEVRSVVINAEMGNSFIDLKRFGKICTDKGSARLLLDYLEAHGDGPALTGDTSPSTSEWISVQDRVPPLTDFVPTLLAAGIGPRETRCSERVLVAVRGCVQMARFGEYFQARRGFDWFDLNDHVIDGVTHWSPLPTAPLWDPILAQGNNGDSAALPAAGFPGP